MSRLGKAFPKYGHFGMSSKHATSAAVPEGVPPVEGRGQRSESHRFANFKQRKIRQEKLFILEKGQIGFVWQIQIQKNP